MPRDITSIGYTYKDEFIQDGILRAVEALKSKKFDRTQTNPFTYFTVVMFRTFITRIKNENQKRKTLEHLIMVDELFTTQDGDSGFNRDRMIGDFVFESWASE